MEITAYRRLRRVYWTGTLQSRVPLSHLRYNRSERLIGTQRTTPYQQASSSPILCLTVAYRIPAPVGDRTGFWAGWRGARGTFS